MVEQSAKTVGLSGSSPTRIDCAPCVEFTRTSGWHAFHFFSFFCLGFPRRRQSPRGVRFQGVQKEPDFGGVRLQEFGSSFSEEFEEFEEFGSSLMPGVREFQEFGSSLVPGVRGVRRVREFADPSSSRSSTSAVVRGVDSSEEFDFRSSSRS